MTGFHPQEGPILVGQTLFSTAEFGGNSAAGTVFRVNIDGSGFTTLHTFSPGSGTTSPFYTNSDGVSPNAGLFLSGERLYGTTRGGGSFGNGAVFGLKMDGTGFTNLHSFTPTAGPLSTNLDGASPIAALVVAGNTLYGTTSAGGKFGNGTVFSISLVPVTPPQLTLVLCEASVVLAWPTNPSGFILQSTTNLASPVWTTVSTVPIVVSGQNTVTNSVSGTQQFFGSASEVFPSEVFDTCSKATGR